MTPDEAREKYGISMGDVLRARAVADERFDGNLELGVLFIDSASLAISVKSKDGMSDKEARTAWNESRARSRYAEIHNQ